MRRPATWWRRFLASFEPSSTRDALEILAERDAEEQERALHDPFRFARWEDFVAFRARHGLQTPTVRRGSRWWDRARDHL